MVRRDGRRPGLDPTQAQMPGQDPAYSPNNHLAVAVIHPNRPTTATRMQRRALLERLVVFRVA